MKKQLTLIITLLLISLNLYAESASQQCEKFYNTKDYKNAITACQQASQQGNAKAQYNLGVMYTQGQGVPQDYTKARQYFEQAAKQGNAKAQYNLALMYYNGEGVAMDRVKAKQYFQQACENGNKKACKYL